MGKSSSSSSSSDSSDDENKRWKKEQKRQKKLQKYGPGYQKQHKKGKKGKHGKAYGAPGQFNVGGAPNPYGGGAPIQYPGGQPAGPPGGAGYPQSGYPGQQPGAYPPQPGYPQGPGGPGFSSAPGYPPQPGGGPELGFGGPPAASGYPPAGGAYPPAGGGYPPAGGAYPPAGGAYPPAPGAGGLGFDMPSGYSQPPGGGYPPAQSGYGGPPGASFPGQPGAPPSQPAGPPAQGGYPGQPPTGYPPQSAGAPPAQAGYGTQAGYGAQTGYGAQPGAPPPGGPYGAQPTGAPPGGYASKPVSQPPVSQPPAAGYQQQQPSSQPARPPPPTGAAQPSASSSIAGQFSKMTVMGTAENYEGTITAAPSFDAEKDANVLRTAMKGMGTDEAAIIEVVRNRSNVQRQQIKKLFKTMFGKDLIKELQGELSGNFRECIMALFEPTIFYDAWSLNQAMMGLGTKEGVLIEILCTRTNAEIQAIVKCYKEYFRRDLEKDIVDDTSGHFKRLLVSCCQANRTELTPAQWERVMREGPECVVDRAMAKREAEELFRAGEKKIGTDESTFNRILALRHFYQLRATFEEYAKVSQRDILNSIGREMSGDLESGFKALIMSIKNRPEYFAERLYKSMKGAGTNDSTLIRVVVSRSEIDLKQIKQVFFQKYQKTLAKFIEQDTSGDYKKMLVGIVGYDW